MESSMNISGSTKETTLQRFARAGLASKGVVYCLMGVLSTMAALGLSSKQGDKAEALKMIYEQPFGKILLLLIGVGLLGYVMLRVLQTYFDTERKGNHAKGMATRIGFGISALIYLAISLYAIKLAIGKSSGGGGDSQEFIVSKILGYPAGVWIVVLIALIIIGNGIYQIHKGATGRFMDKVQLYHSSAGQLFKRIGTLGYIARGVVMAIIGYFFLRAALNADPKEAGGTGGAFDFLQQTFGNVLMGLVAVGLIAYGVFMLIRAKHERLSFRTQ